MAIKVRFFASLREQVGIDERDIDCRDSATVGSIWDHVTGQAARPTKLLAAVNLEYADLDQRVRDGDEVAFFPPVTGG
ncbi:MAG: molybdopterin converting factor subunit 1 [Pseudomonadota bacterium]|nr:molybdopterin converting factor subunit 1 [Pseudomonadota bacterium]